jgi:hypothetical protein
MKAMTLSLEVKGYLADLISRESLGRITIIGMRVGISPETIQEIIQPPIFLDTSYEFDLRARMSPDEKAAIYIIENTNNQDLLLKTVLDLAKNGAIGGKRYSRIFAELNSIMERTMQCRVDEQGNIIPIFDQSLQITKKMTYIEKKLEECGFNKTSTNYKDAIETYKTSYKGAISLLTLTPYHLGDMSHQVSRGILSFAD